MLKISPDIRVAVVGLGKSGRSAIEFCRVLGAQVLLSEGGRVDDETAAWLEEAGVRYEDGGHSLEFLRRADIVIISPGVPHYLPVLQELREMEIVVAGELALAAAHLRTPVIAITGTNGKTTVTTLIGNLLRAAGKKVFVGGNIGTPLTDYLAGPQEADWVVLEVSSFQLDAAREFSPNIGVVLNISPDHLDRYEGIDDYAQAKLHLLARQGAGDTAIVNYEDAYMNQAALAGQLYTQAQIMYFGHDLMGLAGAEIKGRQIHCSDSFSYNLSGTLGQSPNLENAAAAILAAGAAGCAGQDIQKGLNDFEALPHRMTLVSEIGGVCYIDDSKATNIGAVAAALASVAYDRGRTAAGSVVLIAGGRDKGGDYGMLADLIRDKVKAMLLIGEASEKIASSLAGLTKIETMASLEDAVNRAAEISRSGDTVLLSPACASFDMFASYAERGDVFEQQVLRLGGGERG